MHDPIDLSNLLNAHSMAREPRIVQLHVFFLNMMKSILFVALLLSCVCASATNETAGDPFNFIADPTIIDPADVHNLGSWTSYKQCDSRWANQQLGRCSLTICQAGCAMSSVAMMLATKGASVNPASLDSWLTRNGGYESGCDIVWSAVSMFCVCTFMKS